MELCDLNALELARIVRQRDVSAVEVVKSCLKRIEEVDGKPGSLAGSTLSEEDRQRVHAFITLSGNAALLQAENVDRAYSAGEKCRPNPLFSLA